ncbi:MAG: TrkA family potassium uptake protein [Thermodesulfobacteriota bacterium]
MKVGVIGLGNFGTNVVRELFRQGFDVLALDRNSELVQKAQEFSTKAVVADCTDKDALTDLGFGTVDVAIVSMGEELSASVLAALYLKEMGVKKVIVKALSEDHRKILEKVGADQVVFPEREVAVKLAKSIARPNVLDYLPLSEEFAIMEVIPPLPFVGKSILDLDLRKNYGIQIMGIVDGNTKKLAIVVSPERIIGAHDRLIVLGRQQDVERIRGIAAQK